MSSSSRRSTTALLGAVVAGLIATAPVGEAAEFSYGADAGLGYSDNVTRVPEGEQAETIASVGAQLRLDHQSNRLNANLATRLEYRHYLDDTFEGEVIGNLIANGVLGIIEERFTWTLDDTFGQTTLNQFAPVTPANRESVNHLSTGPDFTLPLGSRNKLIVHGRYVDVHYEQSALGNHRLRGELALQRELSDASRVSLNATTERVTFDDDTQFVNFDHDEAFLSYHVDAARTRLSIDAGVTEIVSNDASDESEDSWLGRLELTRHASASLIVGIELGHDISDAGNSFAQLQSVQPGSVDPVPVQQTAAPFENSYGAAFARFSRNRTAMRLRVGYAEEDYRTEPLFDRRRFTLDVDLQRNLNAAVTAHIGANYSHQEFEAVDRKFADLTTTLGLRWNFGRVSFLSVDYQFLDRNDDASGADYRANELWVRLAYLVGEGASGGGFDGP